jgi:tRNA(Arg) A34 adenosine deaminase TadA
MELALKQALLAEQKGEVPVGAVLVKNNKWRIQPISATLPFKK